MKNSLHQETHHLVKEMVNSKVYYTFTVPEEFTAAETYLPHPPGLEGRSEGGLQPLITGLDHEE